MSGRLWGEEEGLIPWKFPSRIYLKQRFGSRGPVSLARQCLFEESQKQQKDGKWSLNELVLAESFSSKKKCQRPAPALLYGIQLSSPGVSRVTPACPDVLTLIPGTYAYMAWHGKRDPQMRLMKDLVRWRGSWVTQVSQCHHMGH